MVNLDFLFDAPFIINSIMMGITWYIGFLYIRKGFNPANADKMASFQQEALYGGVAAALSPIVSRFVTGFIVEFFGLRL